jgi:hypothetical protein
MLHLVRSNEGHRQNDRIPLGESVKWSSTAVWREDNNRTGNGGELGLISRPSNAVLAAERGGSIEAATTQIEDALFLEARYVRQWQRQRVELESF